MSLNDAGHWRPKTLKCYVFDWPGLPIWGWKFLKDTEEVSVSSAQEHGFPAMVRSTSHNISNWSQFWKKLAVLNSLCGRLIRVFIFHSFRVTGATRCASVRSVSVHPRASVVLQRPPAKRRRPKPNLQNLVVEPTTSEKICSSKWIKIFPNLRGENWENIWNHQLVNEWDAKPVAKLRLYFVEGKGRCLGTDLGKSSVIFQVHPQRTNMEPENHPFGKEKHLPSTSNFWVPC